MLEERRIGGQAHSYDTNGLVFEKRGQDLFHDIILGMGAGDLTVTTGGANRQTHQQADGMDCCPIIHSER